MELNQRSDLRDELKSLIPASFSEERTNKIRKEVAALFSDANRKRTAGSVMAGPRLHEIENIIDFSNVKFDKFFCCKGFLFHLPVTIENCVLKKDVSFEDAIFVAESTIKDSNLELQFDLSGSHHHKFLWIEKTLFGSHLIMNKCHFSSGLSFESAKFSEDLLIRESAFSENVRMVACSFGRNLDLIKSKFANQSLFALCSLGGVHFDHVEFNEKLNFSANEVGGTASFFGARFGGLALFSATTFDRGVSFQTTQFDQHSYFTTCKFFVSNSLPDEDISFEDCTFKAPVSFQKTTFKNRYPILTGVSLPEVALFSADDKYWPKCIDQNSDEVSTTCAAIRHCCEKQGFHDEEHFFFGKRWIPKEKAAA